MGIVNEPKNTISLVICGTSSTLITIGKILAPLFPINFSDTFRLKLNCINRKDRHNTENVLKRHRNDKFVNLFGNDSYYLDILYYGDL